MQCVAVCCTVLQYVTVGVLVLVSLYHRVYFIFEWTRERDRAHRQERQSKSERERQSTREREKERVQERESARVRKSACTRKGEKASESARAKTK